MADRSLVTELYGRLRLPVFVAPMFLISGPEMVIAAGKAGLLGALPAPNARTIEDLAEWLPYIAGELKAVGRERLWAINMIVHPSYERFDAELDLICEHQPRLVITALGSPRRPLDLAIGGGRAIRAALTLGADFAYMGTRFIATKESLVSDDKPRHARAFAHDRHRHYGRDHRRAGQLDAGKPGGGGFQPRELTGDEEDRILELTRKYENLEEHLGCGPRYRQDAWRSFNSRDGYRSCWRCMGSWIGLHSSLRIGSPHNAAPRPLDDGQVKRPAGSMSLTLAGRTSTRKSMNLRKRSGTCLRLE